MQRGHDQKSSVRESKSTRRSSLRGTLTAGVCRHGQNPAGTLRQFNWTPQAVEEYQLCQAANLIVVSVKKDLTSHTVFAKRLAKGDPPNNWDDLLAASLKIDSVPKLEEDDEEDDDQLSICRPPTS